MIRQITLRYQLLKSWRRGRDLNPRYGCPYAAFRVRCIRPLCHLSGAFCPRAAVGAAITMTRRRAQDIWTLFAILAARRDSLSPALKDPSHLAKKALPALGAGVIHVVM